MQEKWRLITHGALSPALNMAIDEKLTDWHREGHFPVTLRFYEWAPAGLSVGYFQKTEGRIDTKAVKAHGFEMVRRQTGGQAVLHDDELTYSIIINEKHSAVPKTILAAHKVISEALLCGLHKLGIEAGFAIPEDKHSKGTAICFEEPSWYEITYNHKKLVGSAQARLKGVLLQHGSIPLTIDEQKLFDLFIFENERLKARMQSSFSGKATGIYNCLDREIPIADIREALQQGFAETFHVDFEPYTFSKSEWAAIEALAEKKFRQDDYTLMR